MQEAGARSVVWRSEFEMVVFKAEAHSAHTIACFACVARGLGEKDGCARTALWEEQA